MKNILCIVFSVTYPLSAAADERVGDKNEEDGASKETIEVRKPELKEGARDAVKFFVDDDFTKTLKAIETLKDVKEFSVSHSAGQDFEGKRISAKLISEDSLRDLQKILFDSVKKFLLEIGGLVIHSEKVLPPVTFTIVSRFSDGNIKIDSSLFQESDGDKYVVIFLTRF